MRAIQPNPARFLMLVSGALALLALWIPPRWSGAQDRIAKPGQVGRYTGGAVASASPIASDVGAAVLRDGGNAVDAAVATAFALAVTHPEAGNLGGGGFMVVRRGDTGEVFSFDFRERAPAAAARDMFLDGQGERDEQRALFSGLSVGVPGTPAGLELAHQRLGSRPWKELLAPAVELAGVGFFVNGSLAGSLARRSERLLADPGARKAFAPTGTLPVEGDTLRQPDLAGTLQRIAAGGAGGFYSGETARDIVATIGAAGGVMTLDDMARYEAVERPVTTFSYRDLVVHAMGPPSSGGVTLGRILRVWEEFDVGELDFHGPDHLMLMAEVEKRAYRDRNTLLGDPDFVPDMPLASLLGIRTARSDAAEIDLEHSTPSQRWSGLLSAPPESPNTTHFSVVDANGWAVSCTVTLNLAYGTGIVAEGTGVLLNNELDDFVSRPGVPNAFGLVGNQTNAIEPGKRPLSSMTPTIVVRDGQPFLVAGSPGGSTIITTVAQVISNVVDFGMPLVDAVAAARVHHQWLPDRLDTEAGALEDAAATELERRGLAVRPRSSIGDVHAIVVHPDGTLEAVSDPRGGGQPAGW